MTGVDLNPGAPVTAPVRGVRLTIAIPTLNRAGDLRRAIESALAQSSREIEIVVSNNGSTDDTRAVMDSYADSRLRMFHRSATIPAAEHGNFLIEEARGELFLGLSDDDYLEPGFAQRVIELYDMHPEVSFVYTRCYTHVGAPASTVLQSPPGPVIEDSLAFLRGYFTGQRQLFWCACVTRTADLRRCGGLPPGIRIGDLHLWTQLVFSGPVGCVDALLSHYTYLTGNSSIRIPVCEWSGELRAAFDRICDRLVRLPASSADRAGIEKGMRQYLAVSTANQLVLNASQGASKASLLRALRVCGADLRGNLRAAMPRVLFSLLLPAKAVAASLPILVTGRGPRRQRT